jgi:hypothetical protein
VATYFGFWPPICDICSIGHQRYRRFRDRRISCPTPRRKNAGKLRELEQLVRMLDTLVANHLRPMCDERDWPTEEISKALLHRNGSAKPIIRLHAVT